MCYFFASRLSKASAKIIVTEKSITHIWNKKFMLSKEDDLTIPWGEIKSYGLHGDRLFDNFEFNLKNKTRYQINRLSFVFYKDDFKLFIADLPILTEKNGTNVTDSEHRRFLADSKDSLAPKIIKGFIILVGLLFTFMLLSKIFIPDSQINWTGIYVTGAVLVLYLIYLKLNNANIR
jgi:hypothetical protein